MQLIKSFKAMRKSIFTTWLVSYFAILLIPVLISAFVFLETGRVIRDEINRANTSILKQVVQVIDSNMRDVERLSVSIALNEQIRGLLHTKKPFEFTDRYIIGEVVKRIWPPPVFWTNL